MSLYQCEHCGCMENTALGCYWSAKVEPELFDWTGIEDRKGKRLCSVCGPTRYSDDTSTEYGKWHGFFDRTFLPMGAFRTNREGNLEHIETGRTDYRAFAIEVAP